MSASVPTTSIVVEMDNAAFAADDTAARRLELLLDHIASTPEIPVRELIVAHADRDSSPGGSGVEALVARLRDRAAGVEIAAVGVTGGRYYDLKNAGMLAARGEVVVFIDSDCEPQPGWLRGLLEPFRDPTALATCGPTSLRPDSFIARLFAVCWFFPPPGAPLSEMPQATFFANNVAFRAAWLRDNPFPDADGFTTACVQLSERLRAQGHELAVVDARVLHDVWTETVRGILWRAAVDGRDADRNARRRLGPARWRRISNAAGRWARLVRRSARRVSRYGRSVGLRRWQLPLAVVAATAFWTLNAGWQAAAALGVARPRREEIPGFVEVS